MIFIVEDVIVVAVTFPPVSRTAPSVFVGRDREVRGFSRGVLGVQLLKEWNAPSTAGSGVMAFAEPAGDPGFPDFQVGADLSKAHSKAEADVFIGIHGAGASAGVPDTRGFLQMSIRDCLTSAVLK